jgi:hypothetical protein
MRGFCLADVPALQQRPGPDQGQPERGDQQVGHGIEERRIVRPRGQQHSGDQLPQIRADAENERQEMELPLAVKADPASARPSAADLPAKTESGRSEMETNSSPISAPAAAAAAVK